MSTKKLPHTWERGYRCHGYWKHGSAERLGCVSLGPRGRWDGWYRVALDFKEWFPGSTGRLEYRTLKAAKRCVERAVILRESFDQLARSMDNPRSRVSKAVVAYTRATLNEQPFMSKIIPP